MNTYRVRVYYEDTDCGRIVYHTNYIKYCERARSEIFFSQNKQPFEGESGFVLKNIQADFISSARLGDLLEVRSEVKELKNASIILEQNIYRIYNALQDSTCDELVFSARITLAFVNVAVGKPCKIPPSMRELFIANQ